VKPLQEYNENILGKTRKRRYDLVALKLYYRRSSLPLLQAY